MYVLWDVIGMFLIDCRWSTIQRAADDTIARKVNSSDASAFAKICGCFPSQGTNFPLLTSCLNTISVVSLGRHMADRRIHLLCRRYNCWTRCLQSWWFSLLPYIVILIFYQQSAEEQKADSQDFLPTPGSGALSISPSSFAVSLTACALAILGLL